MAHGNSIKVKTNFNPDDLEQIHKRHGHFADQISFSLFSTASPAGKRYSSPEWCRTSFPTAAHGGNVLHGRVLCPIPAEGCPETDMFWSKGLNLNAPISCQTVFSTLVQDCTDTSAEGASEKWNIRERNHNRTWFGKIIALHP